MPLWGANGRELAAKRGGCYQKTVLISLIDAHLSNIEKKSKESFIPRSAKHFIHELQDL